MDLIEFEKIGFKKQTEIKYKNITVLLPNNENDEDGYCVITPFMNFYLVDKNDALRICKNAIKKLEKIEKVNNNID